MQPRQRGAPATINARSMDGSTAQAAALFTGLESWFRNSNALLHRATGTLPAWHGA